MIKKRLLRAILNSGVSAWKEFSYDQKKAAILEVTPFDYNTKYALVQLPSIEVGKDAVSFNLDIKGNFIDFGMLFIRNSELVKLSINDGVAHLEQVDIKKSPVLVIGRGNTEQEIDSVEQLSISEGTVLTPIAGVKFKTSIPTITLGIKIAESSDEEVVDPVQLQPEPEEPVKEEQQTEEVVNPVDLEFPTEE